MREIQYPCYMRLHLINDYIMCDEKMRFILGYLIDDFIIIITYFFFVNQES